MTSQKVIQKDRKQNTFVKAQVIATSKRIHKSSVSDIWMVESDTKKDKFYCVQYVHVPELDSDEIVCDCPAYQYAMTVPCKHVLAICCHEGFAEIKKEVI